MERQHTLVSEVMSDMDEDILAFIQQQITSFVRWDTIRFLNENPGTKDTAERLAQYIGRDPEIVSSELEAMSKAGLLEAEVRGPYTIYGLTSDADMGRLIAMLVTAARDRAFRMKLVYHILRRGDQP
jgi:DNA-binding transcriptional ArsR family regulator